MHLTSIHIVLRSVTISCVSHLVFRSCSSVNKKSHFVRLLNRSAHPNQIVTFLLKILSLSPQSQSRKNIDTAFKRGKSQSDQLTFSLKE